MDNSAYILLFLLAVVFGLGTWMFRRANDQVRIRRHIESRGGKILSIEATNPLSASSDRCYAVTYLDKVGNERMVRCVTNGRIGIYFADDCILNPADTPGDKAGVESLEEENARLRAELDRLKRKDSDAIQE